MGELSWTRATYDVTSRTTDPDAAEASEAWISDDELTELALAADADQAIGPDAVPLAIALTPSASALGAWYMPAVVMHRSSGWRRPVVLAIVATLVALEALGLCSVFGQVVVG